MTTDAEEANLAKRGFHRYTSKKYEKIGGVLEVEWVQNLMRQKDTSSVLTAGAMVSKDSLLPIDHMVRSSMRSLKAFCIIMRSCLDKKTMYSATHGTSK